MQPVPDFGTPRPGPAARSLAGDLAPARLDHVRHRVADTVGKLLGLEAEAAVDAATDITTLTVS